MRCVKLLGLIVWNIAGSVEHIFHCRHESKMDAVSMENRDDEGRSIDAITADSISAQRHTSRRRLLTGIYVILLLFMFIYFARPEDWIPGFSNVPLAKITGALGLVAFLISLRYVRLRLPREVIYLILLVGQLFITVPLSPVWPGGAFWNALAFTKVAVIVIVLTIVVNTSRRLCRLILVQAGSVAVIAGITIWNGRLLESRLGGMFGGYYTNPNDLALAIVISLPLCLALLLLSKGWVWIAAWALAMLVMTYAVFLTGSRGGFLSLTVVTAVSLWEFAIRGRRRYLLVLTALVITVMWLSSSDVLKNRIQGIFKDQDSIPVFQGSAEQRLELFWRSIEVTKEHPLFGIGPGNFPAISGNWHVTHNTFTQISSEGGLPALVLFLLILSRGFSNVRKIKKLSRRERNLSVLARALHASMAGYVTGAMFASTAYDFFSYFLVAYTSALLWIAKHSQYTTEERESASRFPLELGAYEAEPEIKWRTS
jgi:putative inorganic carbon (hco3(-)) transporter